MCSAVKIKRASERYILPCMLVFISQTNNRDTFNGTVANNGVLTLS